MYRHDERHLVDAPSRPQGAGSDERRPASRLTPRLPKTLRTDVGGDNLGLPVEVDNWSWAGTCGQRIAHHRVDVGRCGIRVYNLIPIAVVGYRKESNALPSRTFTKDSQYAIRC